MNDFYKKEKVIENEEEYTVKIDIHGNKFWYNCKNKIHRLGGLPAIEYYNGSKRVLAEWKIS